MADASGTGSKHLLRNSAIACLLLLAVVGGGVWFLWDEIAVWMAPAKRAATVRSEAALKADEFFWQIFHDGEYDKIPDALNVVTAAYLQTP